MDYAVFRYGIHMLFSFFDGFLLLLDVLYQSNPTPSQESVLINKMWCKLLQKMQAFAFSAGFTKKLEDSLQNKKIALLLHSDFR